MSQIAIKRLLPLNYESWAVFFIVGALFNLLFAQGDQIAYLLSAFSIGIGVGMFGAKKAVYRGLISQREADLIKVRQKVIERNEKEGRYTAG